jgi:hypothetical protein
MAMDLFYNRKIQKNLYVITLGSPRVGNSEFAKSFQNAFKDKSWRLVHALDLVPHVPSEIVGFQHVPREIWESSPGSYYESLAGLYEDPNGADSVSLRAISIDDHMLYLQIKLDTCTVNSIA